jgi:ferredoxin-NADP reductase
MNAVNAIDFYQVPRFWDGTVLLRCVDVIDEAPNVKTFKFTAVDGSWFRYAAGQFVTLEVPTPGQPVYRTYTLSSTPTRPQLASITVKSQAASIGTRWLLDNLQVGDVLKAIGPAGEFCLPAKREKLLFISAGSGITPMMSMTRFLLDRAEPVDIHFVHFGRSPEELLFHAELTEISRSWKRLKLVWSVEMPGAGEWLGLNGRIDQLSLDALCSDVAEREVFCCGPAPFMKATREAVQARAGSLARYHEESFQSEAPAPVATPSPAPAGDVATDRAEIHFTRSGRTAQCNFDTPILEAARSVGIAIPYACSMGLCGTCKVMTGGGLLRVDHNGGITDGELQEGYVLACCSRPVDRHIEIDA